MKKTILTAVAALSMLVSVDARTWTSSDGSKTFEAEYVSHNKEYVTVNMASNEKKFKIALLSKADRQWLASQKPVTQKSGADVVGAGLKGHLVMLKKGKYVPYEAKSSPEYYIIYYSASW